MKPWKFFFWLDETLQATLNENVKTLIETWRQRKFKKISWRRIFDLYLKSCLMIRNPISVSMMELVGPFIFFPGFLQSTYGFFILTFFMSRVHFVESLTKIFVHAWKLKTNDNDFLSVRFDEKQKPCAKLSSFLTSLF